MTFRTLAITTASIFSLAAVSTAQDAPRTLPNHGAATAAVVPAMLGDELEQPLAAALENRVLSKSFNRKVENELGLAGQKILRRTYAQRVFKPVWTQAGADGLLRATQDLFDHGIVAEEKEITRLKILITERFDTRRSAEARAKSDAKLTLAFLRKAKAMSGGLSDEGAANQPKMTGPLRASLTDALIQAGQGQAVAELDALAPQHMQYRSLKLALAEYRVLKKNGGWLAIPDGDIIEVGETDARIPAIKTRLMEEGFYTPTLTALVGINAASADTYTVDLETALKTFQRRHGLADDGVIGGNTLDAMNESPASKIDKIADSMHRWRVQGDMGDRHIWANIPSYTAAGYENGIKQIDMRTIVGKPKFATQVFSDQVEYMVANPKWFLPVSITRRQKVPKLIRDPGYAQKYGYDIFERETGVAVDAASVDWTQPGVARKYRFVQEAGPGNALGKLKIIFPNQYSIYLHGTPSKSLFERSQRAFSSGCIRLEDPIAMAEWIAAGDPALTPDKVNAASDSGENTRLTLEEQVPVHITYFLVTANEDGTVNFLRDIYDRDDGIEMVEKKAELYIPKQVQPNIMPAP